MIVKYEGSLSEYTSGRKRNNGVSKIFDGAAAIAKAEKLFADNDRRRVQGEASFPEKYELTDDPKKFISWILRRKVAESKVLTKKQAEDVFKYFWPKKWSKYTPDEIWLVDKLCAVTPIKQGREDNRTKHEVAGLATIDDDGTMILVIFRDFISSKRLDLMIHVYDTLIHELAHFLDWLHPYLNRPQTEQKWIDICMDKSETPASLYMKWVLSQGQTVERAVGEEFADSLSHYLMTTRFFRMTRPKRTKFIETLLKK